MHGVKGLDRDEVKVVRQREKNLDKRKTRELKD